MSSDRIQSPEKVWLITGASRGFGAEISRAALERGDIVIATARNPQTVLDSLGNRPNLLAVKLDVTIESDAVQVARIASEKFGRVDVLLNNAGFGLLGAVEEASAEEVRNVFDTNVFGLLHVTRAVLPGMRERRSGHIINISSVGGYVTRAGWGIYSATKFAVEALIEALYQELAPLGIHATVVEPGMFRTDFLSSTSLASTKKRIDQYSAASATREFAAASDHQQPGDPTKLSQGILKLVDSPNPPLRLPLGSDAVQRIREKNKSVEAELNEWLEVALSTDFEKLTGAASR